MEAAAGGETLLLFPRRSPWTVNGVEGVTLARTTVSLAGELARNHIVDATVREDRAGTGEEPPAGWADGS